MSTGFYLLNGKMFEAQESIIHPDNRSFRYGEGLFETIRWCKGQLPLWNGHWSRLTASLPQLYFTLPVHFTEAFLLQEIQRLLKKNKLDGNARVRLTVFKGEGGIWEPPSTSFNYLLQCWPLAQDQPQLNVNGLELGVFDAGWKSCDAFQPSKATTTSCMRWPHSMQNPGTGMNALYAISFNGYAIPPSPISFSFVIKSFIHRL
jgi:branched-chain amino acid aminotransferase